MKIKNQTYNIAKARILPFSRYYHKIFTPIMIAPIASVFLGGWKYQSESWFPYVFFAIWFVLMVHIFLLFQKTRDFISLVNTPALQLPRWFLGSMRSKDPFQVVKEKLPEYLKCPKCADPAISQKRLAWEFHDVCRNCGNDNTLTKV